MLLALNLLGTTPKASAQAAPMATPGTAPTSTLLRPAAVFDGQDRHEGWAVLVNGERITAAGPLAELNAPAAAKVIELPGATLLPGLIEAHSHVLLHPYSETPWNDQVARLVERA